MTVYKASTALAVDALSRSVIFREGDVPRERATFFEAAARRRNKIILVLDRLSRTTAVA